MRKLKGLNRAYFLVYLLAVLPVLLLGILNKAFLTAQTDVFPDQYLPAFPAGMSLAVLAFTALIPIKVQAISRAASEAGAARKTAESLTHIGELLRRMRHQRHDFHHQLQAVYGLLETECYQEARQHIRKTHAVISTSLELIRTDQPHVTALLYTKFIDKTGRQSAIFPFSMVSRIRWIISVWVKEVVWMTLRLGMCSISNRTRLCITGTGRSPGPAGARIQPNPSRLPAD